MSGSVQWSRMRDSLGVHLLCTAELEYAAEALVEECSKRFAQFDSSYKKEHHR